MISHNLRSKSAMPFDVSGQRVLGHAKPDASLRMKDSASLWLAI